MGKLIEKLALENGHTICAKISSKNENSASIADADVCIEFSSEDAVLKNLELALRFKKNIVIGSTGWYDKIDFVKNRVSEDNLGAIYSPNFSLGVQLFFQMIAHAAKVFAPFAEYECAILEEHHSKKIDSPSGTALAMEKIVHTQNKKHSPISSLRVGSIPGKHTLLFDSLADQISITHDARSRDGFAKGALFAADWIIGKKGFYRFEDVFKEGF